jgi:hypothetical protein
MCRYHKLCASLLCVDEEEKILSLGVNCGLGMGAGHSSPLSTELKEEQKLYRWNQITCKFLPWGEQQVTSK